MDLASHPNPDPISDDAFDRIKSALDELLRTVPIQTDAQRTQIWRMKTVRRQQDFLARQAIRQIRLQTSQSAELSREQRLDTILRRMADRRSSVTRNRKMILQSWLDRGTMNTMLLEHVILQWRLESPDQAPPPVILAETSKPKRPWLLAISVLVIWLAI